MEFFKSEKCSLSQIEGEKLFNYDILDDTFVPDECVIYVEGKWENNNNAVFLLGSKLLYQISP